MEAIDGMGEMGGMEEIELTSADRSVSRCLICGSREVRTDEVLQRGWVLLAECPHCDHRWTRPLSDTAWLARAPVRVQPLERRNAEVAQIAEVSSAA